MTASREVPEGSVAVGDRVRLPRGAQPPVTVFINGVEQAEGRDYRRKGSEIVFDRPILKEERVGFGRWLAMFIGIFGTYRKHETVDVEFTRAGKVELASDLKVHGPPEPGHGGHGGRTH